MDPGYHAIPRLQAVFDGARCFGLSDEEVWRAFDDSLDETGADAPVSEYLDELTGVLARRILHKQRRAPSEERVSSGERLEPQP
jgi:hypothetical protein